MDPALVLSAIDTSTSLVGKAVDLVRMVNMSPLDEQIRNAGEQEFRTMMVVAYATARTLIARELGRDPTDPESNAFSRAHASIRPLGRA